MIKNRALNIKKLLGLPLIIFFMGIGIINGQPIPPPPPPGNVPPPPPVSMPPQGTAVTPPPPGWGYGGCLSNPPSNEWMNEGNLNVMATGYDSESVLVQIPLYVSYSFNGVNYDVTVLNSWNPYTQMWNTGVDAPAFHTSYYFNGFTYNFYVVLPTGTYYFNL